jgi:hypothetical protein
LGLLQRVRAFFLGVSFVRRGISMAAGGTSARDFGARAQHCVGARQLLYRNHSFELEIRLHHSHRFLNSDYSVFDCGSVALGEAGIWVTIEVTVGSSFAFFTKGGHSKQLPESAGCGFNIC